ncbi:RNA polymerase subunit sigma, partial [Pseudomonas aeruginosa]
MEVSKSEFVGLLYRDQRGWLLAWLNRNLGSRQLAEDHSQDTFVRLLGRRELPGLRETHAF